MPISRLFYSIEGDTSKLNASLKQGMDSMKQFGESMTNSGKSALASFQEMLNPSKALEERLSLLFKAGHSQAEVWSVYGDKIKTAADATAKMGQIVDPTVAAMVKFHGAAQQTGFSFEGLGKTITDFARNPLQAAQSGVTKMLEGLGPMAVGLGAVATAAGVAAVAVFEFVSAQTREAEALENLSAITGISVKQLAALKQISKEAGLEGIDLGRMIGKLNQELGDRKANEFTKAAERMGISIKTVSGQTKDAVTVLDEMRIMLMAIDDPTQRAQLANQMLGGRLRELIPLILNSKQSMADLTKEMIDHSVVVSDLAHNRLMEFDARLDQLSRVAQMGKSRLAEVGAAIFSMGEEIARANPKLNIFAATMAYVIGGASGLDAYNVAIGNTATKTRELTDAEKDLHNKMINTRGLFAESEEDLKKIAEAKKKADEAARKLIESVDRLGVQYLKTSGTIYDAVDALEAWFKKTQDAGNTNFLKEATKAAEDLKKAMDDLYFSTTAAMEKADQSWFKGALDSLPKITPSVRKEMDQILRVNTDTGKDIAAIWKRQISTIVSDFSRGFADILFAGKSFGETLKNIFIDIGKSIVRTMVEILFQPLEKYLIKILTGMMGLKVAAGSTGSSGDWGGETGTGTIGAGGMSKGSAVLLGGTGAYMGVKGMFDPGVKGWAETIGGGAALGAAIGSFLPGVGTAIGALTGAMWATIAKSIQAMVRGIMGKDAWTAGVMEAARDLGGIQIGKDAFASFFKNIGINEATAYPIRKDLMFSPAYLTQIAGPAAEQQGKMDAFLKSLEHISVDSKIAASGFINLRTAYEAGIKTGDFSELNKQYQDLFKNSKALTAAFPEFMDKLAAAADITWKMSAATLAAYKGFTNIRDVISQSIAPIDDMYGTFAKTGLITAEFAAKITELGGDLQKFRDLGALVEINSEFGDLVKHFQDTGEILPGLRDLFKQFGGDLKALDDAAALPGLKAGLAGINDLISGMKALQPQAMAIQDLFKGVLNTEGLLALGLDPAKLKPFADLTKMMQGWDQAVQQFQQAGKLETGGILSQGLSQYGGQAGAAAMANYQAGFNTITSSLLASTKAAMDASYQDTIKAALDYLGTIQKETSDKITTLTTAVETELGKVNTSITTALNSAKTDVVAVLNAILAQLGGTPVEATGTTPAVTSPVTGPPIQQPVMPHAGPTIIIQGPVYGFDDFAAQVERAGITLQRRGSPVFAT